MGSNKQIVSAEVENRFEILRQRNAEARATEQRGLRQHALYCASLVYNGWLGDRLKYPEHERITDLADQFAYWLTEVDPGGEAAREVPPNDLSNWRVRHPGLGVITYPDEESARTAAGTAGRVFGPGESHHTDTP